MRVPSGEIPETKKLTVAVVPFDAEDGAADAELSDERILAFERYFFPARLVAKLRESPWVKEAHAAPGVVHSVDLVLRGTITRSTPEETSIRLVAERIDGSEAAVESFSASVSGAEAEGDPIDPLWVAAANWVADLAEAQTPEERRAAEHARLEHYAEREIPEARTSKASLDLVSDIAAIEREKVLEPSSAILRAQSGLALAPYAKWRVETAALAAKARSERTQANFKSAMAFLLVAAAGAQQIANAQAGLSTTPDASYYQAMNTSQKLLTDASANRSKAIEIESSGAEMTAAFSRASEPTTVTVANGVYTLAGDTDARLAQLREIAGAKLRLELGL